MPATRHRQPRSAEPIDTVHHATIDPDHGDGLWDLLAAALIWGSDGLENLEGGMARRDGVELFVGGVGSDTFEEDAHLHLPPLEIGPQHWDLLLVVQLASAKGFDLLADSKLTSSSDA